MAERLLQRLAARAVHLLQALALEACRIALGLAEHALLVLAVSVRRLVGVLLGVVAGVSASLNVGSLDFLICSSVTSASAICWSIAFGPAERSVASGGTGAGIASRRRRWASPARPGSFAIGSTGLAFALEASGAATVASLMSFSESSLPPLTIPVTLPLTSSAPPSLKSSASSRFLGAELSTASLTAWMNAARSNAPGSFVGHLVDLRGLRLAATMSLPGGTRRALRVRRRPRSRARASSSPRPRPPTCPSWPGTPGPRAGPC